MMDTSNLIAQASTTIAAPKAAVWEALTNPTLIKQYMFGADVVSAWQEGSPIIWRGELKGRRYEDKGTILKLVPQHTLQYSHYSPLSGMPDEPQNYHTVTIEILGQDTLTHVSLSQDNNASAEERDHSAKNWATMLQGLKGLVERKHTP
jgi:uncharacterized protein YndB with AHSA1/START domain